MYFSRRSTPVLDRQAGPGAPGGLTGSGRWRRLLVAPNVALLGVAPGSYSNVFLESFFIAAGGLAILVLFVENRSARHAGTAARLSSPLRSLCSHRLYRRVLVATALLSVAAVSDSFLFLT